MTKFFIRLQRLKKERKVIVMNSEQRERITETNERERERN